MECGLVRVDAYMRSLPKGFESFPAFQAKASMLRSATRVCPFPDDGLARLPARLRALVTTPPPVSSWVSEVDYCALSLAIGDVHGWSDEEFGRFWYNTTTDLVRSKPYRELLRMLTPNIILRSAAWRWSAFHRGLTLHARGTPEGLNLQLLAPEGLLPPVCISAYAQVFQATLDGSGGAAKVALVRSKNGGALYSVRNA